MPAVVTRQGSAQKAASAGAPGDRLAPLRRPLPVELGEPVGCANSAALETERFAARSNLRTPQGANSIENRGPAVRRSARRHVATASSSSRDQPLNDFGITG